MLCLESWMPWVGILHGKHAGLSSPRSGTVAVCVPLKVALLPHGLNCHDSGSWVRVFFLGSRTMSSRCNSALLPITRHPGLLNGAEPNVAHCQFSSRLSRRGLTQGAVSRVSQLPASASWLFSSCPACNGLQVWALPQPTRLAVSSEDEHVPFMVIFIYCYIKE